MAKYTKQFTGDFNHFIEFIKDKISSGSLSASFEEEQSFTINDVQCQVIIFERYSYTGQNRVSMNVTVLGYNQEIFLTAITSGGSQATFFKINTWGESSFLDTLINPVEQYIQKYSK